MGSRVLVVEDDAAHAKLMCANLGCLASVEHASTFAAALRAIDATSYDAVVLDVGLPDGNGFEIQRRLREQAPAPPIVFVTSDDLADHAIRALRDGAIHYVIKRPGYLDEMSEAVAGALSHRRPPEPEVGVRSLIGSSAPMRRVRQTIANFAPVEHAVLVTGETGTGKDVVARLLHDHSGLGGPFVAANCAAITSSLFESELFGSERGAFTGAGQDRVGLVGAAGGGTLFLDEIGEVPPGIQAKLLRFLETGTYRPVGATSELRARVRIIAATNRELAGSERGAFRPDLYYRLNVLRIDMPPLRSRPGDIPELVEHFLRSSERFAGCSASSAAVNELMAWHWPGNVRELKHCVERTLVRGGPRRIDRFDLALRPATTAGLQPGITTERLVALLHRHAGRLGPVAHELSVSVRTVQRHMRSAGLSLRDFRPKR